MTKTFLTPTLISIKPHALVLYTQTGTPESDTGSSFSQIFNYSADCTGFVAISDVYSIRVNAPDTNFSLTIDPDPNIDLGFSLVARADQDCINTSGSSFSGNPVTVDSVVQQIEYILLVTEIGINTGNYSIAFTADGSVDFVGQTGQDDLCLGNSISNPSCSLPDGSY